MDLRDLDLNLLVVFNQLLLDRSVSVAAEKLRISQPGVSNSLKRLRTLLKDELFVRTSKGMEPTPYALHLAEPVAYALNAVQTALFKRDAFDPLSSTRTFHLAMTDIGEMYFMPPLMDALSTRAPHIQINTLRPNAVNLRDDMESGTVDIALGLLPHLQAAPQATIVNIASISGLRADLRGVADFQMAAQSRLSGQNDVIPQLRAAGNS